MSNVELAASFGRTPVWISIVRNSDAFRVKMRQLQDTVEFSVVSDIPTKLAAAAEVALERVAEHLDSPSCSPKFAAEVANDFLGMLGYSYKTPKGATPVGTTLNQQINVYGPVDRATLSAARELMNTKQLVTLEEKAA
jgi:hypothetical protein